MLIAREPGMVASMLRYFSDVVILLRLCCNGDGGIMYTLTDKTLSTLIIALVSAKRGASSAELQKLFADALVDVQAYSRAQEDK